MNKEDLIQALSERTGDTKKKSREAINHLLDIIKEGLVEGEKIQLVGFGSFEVRERKARKGRNPRKPEEVIDIPASKAPVFKAGKTLKDAVNI